MEAVVRASFKPVAFYTIFMCMHTHKLRMVF